MTKMPSKNKTLTKSKIRTENINMNTNYKSI